MRPSEKLAALITAGIFVLSGFAVYQTAKHNYGTEVPQAGGVIREGVIGYARFINPLLAFTDADKDLTTLIYSGLLKVNSEGTLVGDLAESWSVSDDGLIYTVHLRADAQFQDGEPVTADDIEFTIQKAVDPLIKSPRAVNWSGVTVAKVSPYEITFTLKKPYAPFAENLTMGILPKHIWESVAPEAFDVSTYNKEPIGSGPYKIKTTKQNTSGLYEYYELEPFEKYALGEPYIKKVVLTFFTNEEDLSQAFIDNEINLVGGISPELASATFKDAVHVEETALPRIFALFFNQNTDPVLINKEVRKALNISVDRTALVTETLKGYGIPAYSPLPDSLRQALVTSIASTSSATLGASVTTSTGTAQATETSMAEKVSEARALLEANGWKIPTSTSTTTSNTVYEKTAANGQKLRLSFTISTSNSPELKQMAESLRDQWAKIGAEVKIDVYENTDLTQKIIRPRKYSALLFGQVTGREMDLYPFWHSSQRVDPGLNIALYANIKADKALETARSTSDRTKQLSALNEFDREITADIPAIFLFSPEYIYGANIDIKNIHTGTLGEPSERFSNIQEWYTDTKFTWKKPHTEK